MAKLVENLRAAYKARITKLPWMTEETKKAALRKLETINVKIGYPDQWRDYSTLEIKAGDAFGNRQSENAFQRARDIARLVKGADRNDWGMAPQTVNAYYNSTWNEIVFPAAILQPPFFDLNADPAVNYGGIGAVIGHEMGHGFDDQGSKSDEKGVLRKWWVEEDEKRFKELTGKLSDQYSKFEALPGLFVNGKSDAGREHRRSRWLERRARGLQDLAGRQGAAGDRRVHQLAAILPRLRSDLALALPRRGAPPAGGVGQPLAGRVPGQRHGAQHGRVVRRVRREYDVEALPAARSAGSYLVGDDVRPTVRTAMTQRYLSAFLLMAFMAVATVVHAQVFSNKEVGQKNQALVDSLKTTEYPYALPIWGAKAVKRGYNIPYPAGLSVQYYGQRSDITIDNLMVGFNNGPTYDLDGIVRFDKAEAISDGASLRPDIWLFPFLNLYAIFGVSKASTNVGYSLWLPDSAGNEQKLISLGSTVDFTATTMGFGLTPTLGVGGGWMALDMNFTWTDIPQLNEPASAFVFDPRVGKAFRLRRADENINVWVGGFRVALNTGTSGSIPLGDALPIDQWQGTVDQAKQEVARRSQENEAWWNSLTPAQQADPANRARYEGTKAALDRAGGLLESADQAVSNAANATVQYSLDKRPADMWNFTVGGQYQLNKSWMFRLEVGFITSRTHLIAGAQYRFGL